MKTNSAKLALVAAVATATSVAGHVSKCEESAGNALGVSQVSADVSKNVLSIAIEGRVEETIQKGELTKLSVSAYGIPLFTEAFDLCEVEGAKCPMVSGTEYALSNTHVLPSGLPSSIPLDIKVETITNDASVLSCIEADVAAKGEIVSEVRPGVLSVSQGIRKELNWELQHFKFLFDQWFAHFESEIPVEIDDLDHRFEIFRENLRKIVMHNLDGHSYTMAMNQFGHMTEKEFADVMLGGFRQEKKNVRGAEWGVPRETHSYNGEKLPDTVDWVSKGAVTPVKNQGACGSCWSFSTTGALEGAYFLKTGKLVSFSEEQLVACDHGDFACGGGLMDNAFKWIENNGGICAEEEVPYVSGTGTVPACKTDCKIVPGSKVSKFVDVGHTEESLESAVAKQPVAIAIEADQGAFQFYSGGVLTQRCGTQLDHGVLAVGYGVLDGVKYWKVKNSWGPSWGNSGYINLERGLKSQDGGECGILMSASYPEV